MIVRAMGAGDVERALVLAHGEGWVFDRPEFERLLRLGEGLVLEEGGRVLGMLTVTHYPDLAWIGNVVVAPSARGRGLGARLVEGAVSRARDGGRRTVALYSVPKAVPLYERAGFRRFAAVVSMTATDPQSPGGAEGVARMAPGDVEAVARFDAALAGFDRRALLEELLEAYADTALVLRRGGEVAGFAFSKPSRAGSEVGPVVAADAEATRALVGAAVAGVAGARSDAAVPAANGPARARFAELGFEEFFEAPAMCVGPAPPTRWEAVAAIGGLEKG